MDTQIDKALAALKALASQTAKENAHSLLEKHADDYWLVVATIALPTKLRVKPQRIPLAHSIYDNPDICVFSKDPQEKYQVHKTVIGVDALRKNYKTYEQKRQLCASFDLFLADEAILPLLPKLLGKVFFDKKKLPRPISFKKDPKIELANVLQSTWLNMNKGVCTAIRVGTTRLTPAQNKENVEVAMEAVVNKLGGWDKIQSINLKTSSSMALPIYNSVAKPLELDSVAVPVA